MNLRKKLIDLITEIGIRPMSYQRSVQAVVFEESEKESCFVTWFVKGETTRQQKDALLKTWKEWTSIPLVILEDDDLRIESFVPENKE